jgi:hypothetical protein
MAEPNIGYIDLTQDGVVFSEWPTEVSDDDLTLVGITYGGSGWVDFPQEGFGLALPEPSSPPDGDLEALFISREKKAVVRFSFRNVQAFRVLDEGGLVELWHASQNTPRPANTTFKVRGHGWQAESALEWLMSTTDNFSYMIATSLLCLEVVCSTKPSLELTPAVIRAVGREG